MESAYLDCMIRIVQFVNTHGHRVMKCLKSFKNTFGIFYKMQNNPHLWN